MIQMDIQLREGNRNFLLIKGKLHSFLHGIIQVPVVAAAAPQLCHQCHGTLLQFPHRYNRSGILKNPFLLLRDAGQQRFGSFQIRPV